MVDLLQVLEGATYAAFIVGAIVAVFELRAMSRDRKTEMMFRNREFFCSREFEEATVNAVKGNFEPGKVSDVDMKMVADYWDYMATMVRRKLVDFDTATQLLSYDRVWDWIKPWVLTWEDRVGKGRYEDFEWMANEEHRRRHAETGFKNKNTK